MNRVWTEEELEILRQDRAAKVPVPVTAAKLGRPVPATYARARLIGTLVQPHQPWDEASVARLRALVSSDPPMTDKRIGEELGRTVTQIRWKMQDLGLIGVRDLSKLAKVTASETSRSQAARPAPQKPVPQRTVLPARTVAPIGAAEAVQRVQVVQMTPPVAPVDFRTALELALKPLEASLAVRLKNSVLEAEAGMVRAATDAIAEKRRIDLRLADLGKRIAAARGGQIAEAERVKARTECTETAAPTKRRTGDRAVPGGKHEVSPARPKRTEAKPAPRRLVGSAVPGASQVAAPRQTQPPSSAPTPKIVVVETPVAVRPEAGASSEAAQLSGRGGWKSVRRDPARVMAQAKAKATSRADAVDLAMAAQAAIDRFIRERGVTKTEASGISAIVSRLQARGYIVVQDGGGWIIDQRHRVDGESALIAFAAARGISLDMAA